eukprot:SAG11_NODE_550_length_8588_cov_9.354105_3_plen_189_part_00
MARAPRSAASIGLLGAMRLSALALATHRRIAEWQSLCASSQIQCTPQIQVSAALAVPPPPLTVRKHRGIVYGVRSVSGQCITDVRPYGIRGFSCRTVPATHRSRSPSRFTPRALLRQGMARTLSAACCPGAGPQGCAGMPESCSPTCAAAFLPIWRTCGETMRGLGLDADGSFERFATQCRAQPGGGH